MKNTGVWLLVMAIVGVVAFFSGRGTTQQPAPIVRVDTLVTVDTVRIPVPTPEYRYVTRVDTISREVIVNLTDTVTVYVPIDIERTRYATEAYDLTIEGFRSRLVSIETYNKTVYVDRWQTLKTKPRWGAGVQLGYGYDMGRRFYPYIGVGVQYNLITW